MVVTSVLRVEIQTKVMPTKQTQNANKKQAFWRRFSVKDRLSPSIVGFPQEPHISKYWYQQLKMPSVAYNSWVKPNHWEHIMKCHKILGVICRAQSGKSILKHNLSAEKRSITMKREQKAAHNITAFVTLYRWLWKCSFICLYSRLKLTYFLMALHSCEPCVWTKLISMVYLNRGWWAAGYLVNVYSWMKPGWKV